MATGDDLIDEDGNDKLDADGNDIIDDGAGNECECGCGEPITCLTCILPGGRIGTYSSNATFVYDKAAVDIELTWTKIPGSATYTAAKPYYEAMTGDLGVRLAGLAAWETFSATFSVGGSDRRVRIRAAIDCGATSPLHTINATIETLSGSTWGSPETIALITLPDDPLPYLSFNFGRIMDGTNAAVPDTFKDVAVTITSYCCRCTGASVPTSDGSAAVQDGSGLVPCTSAQDDDCPP